MNLRKCILQRCFITVVVLGATAVAWAAGRGPQEHKSAPSRPASHPAQHGGGGHAQNQHKAATGHPANTGHSPNGGHTANTGHGPSGGHPASTTHTATGAHTPTGHSPSGVNRVTPGHTAVAGHSTVTGHASTGPRNVSLKGGGSASIRSNGSIRSVNHNGMQINRGVNGGRTVVSEHNGVRVVNTSRTSGYVQRSYMTVNNHSYYSRTYYSGGSYHTSVYRGYYWGGHAYYGFHAGFYFHPGFYGWGFHPWGAPVYWGVGLWGWGGSPWWGFYGGWFNPYPYYTAPAYWLTDYLVAADLQAAYAARQEAAADAAVDAAAASGGTAPAASASATVTLTPEVKEAIADEVKAELAAQQAQAAQDAQTTQNSGADAGASASVNTTVQSAGTDTTATVAPAGGAAPAAAASANAPAQTEERPPALDPARRTFVVDSDLSVTANGQECGLTGGDVLTRLTDTPDADGMVSASVSASKKSDCASGTTVSVKVDDLQEMQNHFAEQLDNGLKEMAKKQGTDGMPKSPDASIVESDIPAPKPDATAEKTLQDQQQAADQAETQAKQEATATPAPDAAAPADGQQKPDSDNRNN